MKKLFLLLLATGIMQLVAFSQQPSYKNKSLSPEARAKDLLTRMNLDEKVMQTQCLWIQKSTILNNSGDFDETKAEEPGDFTIMVGTSSDNTRSVKLAVVK